MQENNKENKNKIIILIFLFAFLAILAMLIFRGQGKGNQNIVSSVSQVSISSSQAGLDAVNDNVINAKGDSKKSYTQKSNDSRKENNANKSANKNINSKTRSNSKNNAKKTSSKKIISQKKQKSNKVAKSKENKSTKVANNKNNSSTGATNNKNNSSTSKKKSNEISLPNSQSSSNSNSATKENGDYVEFTIQCLNIMDKKELWAKGIDEIIPKNGIFYSGREKINTGESVYDILVRICKNNNIALDSKYTPIYSTYYVSGIGNLYEFDCGQESGWKYMVNEKLPGIGSSGYKVLPNDKIVFFYDYKI